MIQDLQYFGINQHYLTLSVGRVDKIRGCRDATHVIQSRTLSHGRDAAQACSYM